jgi:hypothetical protein
MSELANPIGLVFQAAVRAAEAFLLFCYYSRVARIAILSITALAILYLVVRSYRAWRAGWVSLLIEKRLREIKPGKPKSKRDRSFGLRGFGRGVRNSSFTGIHLGYGYLRHDFWMALTEFYLPSFATVVVAILVLAVVVIWPDPPTHFGNFWAHPLNGIQSRLDPERGLEAPEKILEGLIAIIIALIIFVAEAIRSGKSYDEKRVLLKISNLWALGLAITVIPLAYLYPPGTGLTVLAIVAVMFVTLWTFAKVLIHLLSPTAIERAQRDFLRQRIRDVVIASAKDRIGNKILSERLGDDKDVRIEMRFAKSWLPEKSSKYVFIDTGASAILTDVNLVELGRLGNLLSKRVEQLSPVAAPTQGESVAGPSRRAPGAGKPRPPVGGYLLRRFGEGTIRRDGIFSNDRPVLAIRRSVAKGEGVLREARNRVQHAFRFSDDDPPSHAFRHEMRLTKDRLIAAINSGSLGEIDDLRDTYILVAEEFLLALNDLGGGYSAEQATEERNAFFEGWSEVRWLRDDIRDLMIAAAETDKIDVIRTMIFLPFAIATRAIQAGDQLLFQEFINFASFVYVLGRNKGDTEVGRAMVDRSVRYVREVLQYHVESALREGDDEDDD